MKLYTIMESNGGVTIPHSLAMEKKEIDKELKKLMNKYPTRDWWIEPILEVDKQGKMPTEYEDIYNMK